jgi:serine/threonine-protein kinase
LEYRGHQTVTVKAGQVAVVTMAPPEGLLSVNAQPWANVSIDRKDIGETPLANVKVTLGEHELVFRHPTLGERRQTVLVKAGAATRVSVRFDQ